MCAELSKYATFSLAKIMEEIFSFFPTGSYLFGLWTSSPSFSKFSSLEFPSTCENRVEA